MSQTNNRSSETPLQYVAGLIAEACSHVLSVDCTPEVTPAESEFGDFATNVAMQLKDELGRQPREIAGELAETLQHNESVETAEAAGPGFLNITLTETFWLDTVDSLANLNLPKSGNDHAVQVEFISANPTGPLHIGNARGGFIGDVISNVLQHQGHTITREYYFNDGGAQIDKLLESVKVEAGLTTAEERQYGGEYITELAGQFREQLETEDDETLKKLLTKAVFEDYIQPDIQKMGIAFDVWFNETSLLENDTFEHTKQLLKDKELLFERDGALWLDTSQGGDPRRERVFIKSDGQPTYFAPDVAYHVNIFRERKFDTAIKELGPDHVAQFPSVKAAISLLFPDKELSMVGHQQMRLMQNGQEVKMSKRLGQIVTVGELIDEVGPDVARWFILMRSSDTHMDFDLDLARKESQKNPFWYVMYAYVRAKSIQREAAERGIEPGDSMTELNEIEHAMVKRLSRLPDVLEEIERSYEVHHLTFYGRELAGLFHDWYETVRVVDLSAEKAAEKLYFLQQFIRCMDVYWSILSIEPREQM